MSKRTRRNILMTAVVMLYLVCAVFATTACSGGGTGQHNAATKEQVQVTFGDKKVTFATFYDALAWLNGHEANNVDGGDLAKRGYNGYLKDWAPNNGASEYVRNGMAYGVFKITILTQNAVQDLPSYGYKDASGATQKVANGVKYLLAESNPGAEVTLTAGNFNLNLSPTVSENGTNVRANLDDINIGYGKFTLDSMTLVSSHNIYMVGNDLTVAPGFHNTATICAYGGGQSGTTNVTTATGYGATDGDGIAEININSDKATILNLSGGNREGTYNGEAHIAVHQGTINYLMGAGGSSTTSGATVYNGGDDLAIDVYGGTITNLAGLGTVATYNPETITVNMYGGTVTNLCGGTYNTTTYQGGANVELNLYGGEVQSRLYGTQWNSQVDSRYGQVLINIAPNQEVPAGVTCAALVLPKTVAGTYNAFATRCEINIDNRNSEGGAYTNTDFTRVTNWYVGNQQAIFDNHAPNGVVLSLDAPGSSFNNIYMSGSMSSGNPDRGITATIKAAKSINNFYGFPKVSSNTADDHAEIRIGETGAVETTTLEITRVLSGFSELVLNDADVTVGTLIRPSGETKPTSSAAVTSLWEYNTHLGTLTLNNDSTLNCPKTTSSALFYRVESDGSGMGKMYGYAGNVTSNGTSATRPGILVADSFDFTVQVGANANAPSTLFNGTTYTQLKTIIGHFTEPIRDLSNQKAEVINDMYATHWTGPNGDLTSLNNATINSYTLIGLRDKNVIKVTDPNGQEHDCETLTEALQWIDAQSTKGEYQVAFKAAYDASVEWNTPALQNANKGIDSDGGKSVLYTGNAAATSVARSAPSGTNTFKVPATFNLGTDTTMTNIVLTPGSDSTLDIYGNGHKTNLASGLEYVNANGEPLYANVYGGGIGSTSYDTNLTISSGTYATATAGSAVAPSAGALNLTVKGGDFSGGMEAKEHDVTILNNTLGGEYSAGTKPASDKYASKLSYIDASEKSMISGLTSADGSSSFSGTVNLTIDTTQGGDTFVAPSVISGGGYALNSSKGTINMTVKSGSSLNLGYITGVAYNGSGSGTTVKMNIDLPNATAAAITGTSTSAAASATTEVNLTSIRYVNYLTPAAAQTVGSTKANLTVTGTVNAGTLNYFANVTASGADAKLSVVSADKTLTTAESANAIGVLSACGKAAATTGTLTLADGATVNLLNDSGSYQNVFDLALVGTGNKLNVYGNQDNTATNNANGGKGVLNVANSCDVGSGKTVTLGITENSKYDLTPSSANSDRCVNIIQAVSAAKLKAAVGAAGAYWDFDELTKNYQADHFTSFDSALVVRSDAYKNYSIDAYSFVVNNDNRTNGTDQGYMYLSKATTSTKIDLIMVTPSPNVSINDDEDGSAFEFFPTIAAAANAIAGSPLADENSEYTITILSGQPYEMTTNDVDALRKISSTTCQQLHISGNYNDMPASYAQSAVYCAPLQDKMSVDMKDLDLAFNSEVRVDFKDLYVYDSPLSFRTGGNVTVTDTVKDGIKETAHGASTMQSDAGATGTVEVYGGLTTYNADNFAGTNVYMSVTGKNTSYYVNEDIDGNKSSDFLVDQDGIVWRHTTQTDADLNYSYDFIHSSGSKAIIDTVNGLLYTKTDEVYIVSMDDTTLVLGNVNGIQGAFTVEGNRQVTVQKGMVSPAGTITVPGKLSLQPVEATSVGSYKYNVKALNSTGALTLFVPKNEVTQPINVADRLPSSVELGENLYGNAIPEGGDQLITGAAVKASDASKYKESGSALNGQPIAVSDNLVMLGAAEGAHAQDFIIKADDVYSSGTTYNTAVITDAGHANAIYYGADGKKDTTATPSVIAKTPALTNVKGDYPITIRFTGANVDPAKNSKDVTASVRDEAIIEDDGCKLGGNNFDVNAEELLTTNTADAAAGNTDKLDELVTKLAQIVTMDKTGAELKQTQVTYGPNETDSTTLAQITAANSAQYADKTFDVTFTYVCAQNETHTLALKAKLASSTVLMAIEPITENNELGFTATEGSESLAGDVALGAWKTDTAFHYTVYLKVGNNAGSAADNDKLTQNVTAELYREKDSDWGTSATPATFLGNYTVSIGDWTTVSGGTYDGYGKATLTVTTGSVCKSSVTNFTVKYDGKDDVTAMFVGVVPGDVNQSGDIKLSDAAYIKMAVDEEPLDLRNNSFFVQLADVNGSGSIKLSDAAYVQMMVDEEIKSN